MNADPAGADLAYQALHVQVVTESIIKASVLHLAEDKRDSPPDYPGMLDKLAELARGAKRSRLMSPFELQQATSASSDLSSSSTPQKDWSNWRPQPSDLTPVNQRDLDLALQKKWTDRVLNLLAPFWRHFKHLQDPEDKDKYELWRPLIGKTRGGTLRIVAQTLEKTTLKYGCLWPLTESRVVELLRSFQVARESSSFLSSMWRALCWVGDHFGSLLPSDHRDLLHRFQYVKGASVVVGIMKSHQATPPTLNVVKALEERAVNAATLVDRYAASFFRFCIGSSARYSDTLHTQPKSFKQTATTIEFVAWQTKTKDLGDHMKPQPLIAPLLQLGPHAWWKPLIEVTELRLRSQASKEDDYLLPAPSKDRALFVERPCSNSKAIRWMRALLQNSEVQLTPEEIKSMTVSSFRVFMPSLAHQMNIEKERRQYLGRWTERDTADVYTREHRIVVSGIWKDFRQKLQSQGEGAPVVDLEQESLGASIGSKDPAPVPTDLTHPDYGLDVQSEVIEAKEFPLVPPLGKSWPKAPVQVPMDKPPLSKDVRKTDRAEFFLVVNPKKSGMPRKFRVHWFNDDLKCIGCRFCPSKGEIHPFLASDWNPQEYAFCQKAARVCSPPSEFTSEPLPTQDEGSDMGDLEEASLSSFQEDEQDN